MAAVATTTTTQTAAAAGRKCSSPGCTSEVLGNLACPKCKELGLNNYFCGQECFKKNYNAHKQVHTLAKQVLSGG
jgi:methionyl aminopeptidase